MGCTSSSPVVETPSKYLTSVSNVTAVAPAVEVPSVPVNDTDVVSPLRFDAHADRPDSLSDSDGDEDSVRDIDDDDSWGGLSSADEASSLATLSLGSVSLEDDPMGLNWKALASVKVAFDKANVSMDMQNRLLQSLEHEEFEPGIDIVRVGEAGDKLYIVADGEVVVLVDDGAGGLKPVTNMFPGMFFGEISLIRDEPRNATVRAASMVSCLTLSKEDFTPMIAEDSNLRAMIHRMAREKERMAKRRKQWMETGRDRRTPDLKRNEVRLSKCDLYKWTRKEKRVNDYEFCCVLGAGTSGKVYLCRNLTDSKLYAVKRVHRGSEETGMLGRKGRPLKEVLAEIAVMKKLSNPNVVLLYEVIDDIKRNFLYLVSEYCDAGAVMSDARRNDPIVEDVCRMYLRGVVQGVHYLHSQGVIHMDLKPSNILVSTRATPTLPMGSQASSSRGVAASRGLSTTRAVSRGSSRSSVASDVFRTPTMCCKVADLGSALLAGPSGKLALSTKFGGTPAYQSPELFESTSPAGGEEEPSLDGFAVDMWALGVTLYTMAVGRVPFEAASLPALEVAVCTELPSFPPTLSPSLQHLLSRLMDKNPTTRLTISGVAEHPWVTEDSSHPLQLPQYSVLPLKAHSWELLRRTSFAVSSTPDTSRSPRKTPSLPPVIAHLPHAANSTPTLPGAGESPSLPPLEASPVPPFVPVTPASPETWTSATAFAGRPLGLGPARNRGSSLTEPSTLELPAMGRGFTRTTSAKALVQHVKKLQLRQFAVLIRGNL